MIQAFLDTNILVDYIENRVGADAAIAGGCECIVTRNKKDFKDFSVLELFTADELADKI